MKTDYQIQKTVYQKQNNVIGYTPISYDEVKKHMIKLSVSKVDSHHE